MTVPIKSSSKSFIVFKAGLGEGEMDDDGLTDELGEEETEEETEMLALNPITQELPAADIDIEREIQRSVSGAADFSMSDEPIGSTVTDYAMSDEPIGKTNYPDDDDEVIVDITV